jgi:hypothetical protein
MRLVCESHVSRLVLVAVVLCAVAVFTPRARSAASPPAGQPQTQTTSAQEQLPAGIFLQQSFEDAKQKTDGCMSCHTSEDSPTMHKSGSFALGCTDCHGGNAKIFLPAGTAPNSPEYVRLTKEAHPKPRVPENAWNSANPIRAYTKWLKEDADYIKFINPGDLRVAEETCGRAGCHTQEVHRVQTSMMTHGAMLWEAAMYNNGAFPLKDAHFGESYNREGMQQRLEMKPPPTEEETRTKGILPYLEPLQRWEYSEPGNVLRVFERGGEKKQEVGNPILDDENGNPDVKLSFRGFGTLLRTDPTVLGIQKTRLYDPLLSFPGTNDQPGDYRASGCSACHVIYANDRSPEHSSSYAQFGNMGESQTNDPTISKGQPGHPLKHEFTRAIPSSQCMVCHVHPGTNMETTYFGYTWWDNEIDGDKGMYPAKQRNPSAKEQQKVQKRDPERTAIRGNWDTVDFLKHVGDTGPGSINSKLQNTQFADFHSHGWIFRAVYKHDRWGNLLDAEGNIVKADDPDKFGKAVHLKDIHLEKGMHCIDCHFQQDSHGNGNLYGETRNAVEVDCIDCHGSIEQKATLKTSSFAAPAGGTSMDMMRTPTGERRFFWEGGKLYQRAMLDPNVKWEVVQVLDSITPGNEHYSEKSRLAKTIQTDGSTWGDARAAGDKLAHDNSKMTCYACHSSWAPTCYGCHLPLTANQKMPMLHNEGITTRNWTSYDFQVLRDDAFLLGIDGTVTKHRIAPVRSACAILVSSQNADRDWLYFQQQTISSPGFSGEAFSTFVPHTVRAKETKTCTDCHVSQKIDNNAWMAQLLTQGTNLMNFMGRYIYVATGDKGYEAVAVTEHDEPPAVYGSDLHKLAWPADYDKFVKGGRQLKETYDHPGSDILHPGGEVLDVQGRGEYLYTAMGRGGFRIYDIANLDDKDFSERMITAPVSPLGQRFYVKTKYAMAVATPTTLGVDPLRNQFPENEEHPMLTGKTPDLNYLMYGFLYVADREEGLVVVGDPNLAKPKYKLPGVGTLLDGDPQNNYLVRMPGFNPDNKLHGARRITIAGNYAYILCDRGLEVVDLHNPTKPTITAEIGPPFLNQPKGLAVQFRYAFVVDKDGLKVLDVTHLDKPVPVENAFVPLEDARNIYVARTYAYISGGKQGMVIVNVEQPEHPKLDQVFNAGGAMNDVNDIKIGMVSAEAFAFVADGKNGLRVVQILSPMNSPEFSGFSFRPKPVLIATHHTEGPALAVSKGIDRDRAVDESGNQLAVFGRRGARPFNLQEMQRMYLRDDKLYTVTDNPPGPAVNAIEPQRASTGQQRPGQ